MLVRADDVPREAHVLRDPKTGLISLAHICNTESDALKLRRAHLLHKRHEGALDVVAVRITITEVKP